jgi:hypothetical protein
MTTVAQEFLYVHLEPVSNIKKAWPRDLVHEARSQQSEIAERVAAAKACHEKCEQLVRQLDRGIESDLYVEINDDLASALRQVASGVRIKYGLVLRQLEQAHQLADECDEAATLHDAAEALSDSDEQKEQAERVKDRLERLRKIQRYNDVLYRMIHGQRRNALELFDSLRR